jgi:DNA-binding CsgD family transcriptional regulator
LRRYERYGTMCPGFGLAAMEQRRTPAMARLSHTDLKRLFESLVDLYGTSDHDAYPNRVLSFISNLVPNEVVTYNDIDLQRRRTRMIWEPGSPPTQLVPAFDQFFHQHPVYGHLKRTKDGRARTISDLCSRRAFQRSDLYNHYYRKVHSHRWWDQLDLSPIVSPARLLTIAVNRTGQGFTERDREVMNLLNPHIKQALRNAEALKQWKEEAALLKNALRRSGQAVAAISEGGTIQWATSRAERLMKLYWPDEGKRPGRLPQALHDWTRQQLKALCCPGHIPRPLSPLLIRGGRGELRVTLVRDTRSTLLFFQEKVTSPQPDVLKRHGLTTREAEVLDLVTLGRTNPEIAELLGISPRTVQSLVQRIFDKLGVETRTAAATLAMELRQT